MQIRIDRLKQVLQANRESTAPFDIEYWARKRNCGTSFCLIGNYIVAFPENGLKLNWEPMGLSADKIAQLSGDFDDRYEHFGLTYSQFNALFGPTGNEELDAKEQRLQALERFIAYHENDEQTP